jgi:hypothetical protein
MAAAQGRATWAGFVRALASLLKGAPFLTTQTGMRLPHASSLVLCSLALSLALDAFADSPKTKTARDKSWVLTSNEDGISAWKREVPGSDIIALRGEGMVNAPIARVASVLLDYTRAPEWIDSLEQVRVVRMLGPLEFVEYDRVGTPPIIMRDRDFVCRGKLAVDVAEQSLVMTIEPTADPKLPETDCVRGELRGYWKLRAVGGGRKTFVIAEMHGDPKGGVAKWIVNLFQQGWARNTLNSLRAQVAKRDITILPQVQAAFAGKPIEIAIKSN